MTKLMNVPASGVLLLALLSPPLAYGQPKPAVFTPPKGIAYRQQIIMSEGTRLAAELFALKSQDGKKLPTIIMCHGWGGTAAALRPDAVAFAQAGYLVVTFDYRGWGASEGRVVLAKPAPEDRTKGRFTAEERRIINQHPVLGAELLRPIRALKDICQILENHHERWDGTGYPRGLKGEDIPLSARIVSIVDSYHAMISDRPYRPAMTPDQAMEALRGGAGSQWDPFLVDIFLAVLNSLKQSASAEPNVTA